MTFELKSNDETAFAVLTFERLVSAVPVNKKLRY